MGRTCGLCRDNLSEGFQISPPLGQKSHHCRPHLWIQQLWVLPIQMVIDWKDPLMKFLRLWRKYVHPSHPVLNSWAGAQYSKPSPCPSSPLAWYNCIQQKPEGNEPWEKVWGEGLGGELVTGEHGPPTLSGKGWIIISGPKSWLQGVISPSAMAGSEKRGNFQR